MRKHRKIKNYLYLYCFVWGQKNGKENRKAT